MNIENTKAIKVKLIQAIDSVTSMRGMPYEVLTEYNAIKIAFSVDTASDCYQTLGDLLGDIGIQIPTYQNAIK